MTNDQTAAQNAAASSLPDLANSTTPLRVAVVSARARPVSTPPTR